MAWIIGVERTEIRSKPKAMNSSADKGVAGRSMMTAVDCSETCRERQTVGGGSGQRRQDAARNWRPQSRPKSRSRLSRGLVTSDELEVEV